MLFIFIRICQRPLFISIQLSEPSMTTFSQNDINVVLDSQKEVVIFDADNIFIQSDFCEDQIHSNWDARTEHYCQGKPNTKYIEPTEKENTQNQNNMHQSIIEGLNQQIMRTNENLFKVVNNGDRSFKNKIEKPKPKLDQIAEKKSNSILIQGYLNKKTDGLILKWTRRYFVLTPQKLLFFSDESKGKAIGCVNIKIAVLQILYRKGEIILDFQGESQNIILKSDNKQQSELWRDYLEKVVQFQTKQKKIFLRTIHKPLYSESNTIPEREFYKEAETGDILLFYTKHIGAKLQRLVTNSDFDHVGMVVKFRNWEVMVFECNQSSGVSLFQWNQYVRHFNLYEKITYRKLVSPRKTQLEHALLKFVKMNIGKKYELSLSKLLTFQSDFNWQMVKQDNERGYFCSELIAKSYKSIGILDPNKSSCRYWPVDFSEKSQLKLRKGCYLDLQQQILLNKHVKKII